MSDKRRHPRLRRWAIRLVLLLFFLALAEYLISWLIAFKLGATIGQHIDADLRIGHVIYAPPYGLKIWDASLVRGPRPRSYNILDLAYADVRLARIPWRGPLVIASLRLHRPAINFTRDDAGINGGPGLIKPVAKRAPRKLSEILRLNKVRVDGARIAFDDRLVQPRQSPLIWENISIDSDTIQKSASGYTFSLKGNSNSLAEVSASGSIDVDTLVVDLSTLGLNIQTRPDAPAAALPAKLQALAEKYNVQSRLSFHASGQFPLRDVHRSSYTATLALEDFAAHSPEIGSIDSARIRLAGEKKADSHMSQFAFKEFAITAPGKQITLDAGTLDIDAPAAVWNLRKVTGQVCD
jgi:hypothetical protein